MDNQSSLVELPDGCRVPSSDQFGCKWSVEKQKLDWDDKFREAISGLIPEGGFCVDVGACVGMCTKVFSDLVGATGLVVAFEPNRENLFYLNHNVQKFSYSNTFVHPTALGSCVGYGTSQFKAENVGESTVEMKFDGEEYPISFSTLDTSVRQITTRKMNFLKLDVEGWEFFVLVGGWNLILKDRPVIFLEINPVALRKLGCSPNLILDVLKELRYDHKRVQDENPDPNAVYDILCKPKE